MDSVAAYLEVPAHLEDSFLSLSLEYHENTGSTGDMTYSYYFEVPEDTSDELLSAMNWGLGSNGTKNQRKRLPSPFSPFFPCISINIAIT